MKKFISKAKKIAKDFFTNKSAFSLVELIVVLAIMAVMAAVLAPALLGYVEKSRMQKDDSAMDEVVNAIQLSLADQEIYDEVLEHSVWDNVSCYIDKKDESQFADCKVQLKAANGDKKEQYMFGDEARLLDEIVYYAAGNMRGLTITFSPSESGDTYDFANGILNKFVGRKTGYLHENPELYNRLRSVISDKLDTTSQTYRNSDYTVFIRVGSTGGSEAVMQDAIQVWGQFNGTNLAEKDHKYELSSGRIVGAAGQNDELRNEQNNNVDKYFGEQEFSGGSGVYDESGTLAKIVVNNKEVDATWENLILGEYFVFDGTTLKNGKNMKQLTGTLVIDDAVKKIHYEAYMSNNNLLAGSNISRLILGNGITSIPDWSFSQTNNLKYVYIPASVTNIGSGLCTYSVLLEKFDVDPENKTYITIDGVIYTKDKKVLVDFPNAKQGKYIIPEGTLSINGYAFISTKIKELTLPTTMVDIGSQAFDGNRDIEILNINSNISITHSAIFRGCVNLQININNNSNLVFENGILLTADKKEIVAFTNVGTTVKIPQGVEKIRRCCFGNAYNVETLILPKSLKVIGDYNYLTKLKDVKYQGTQDEFEKINIHTETSSSGNKLQFEKANKTYNYSY